jgi:protein-disulfide isomerase
MDILTRRLTELGIRRNLPDSYRDLLSSIAADTRMGQIAGVYSTPTVFLDGVKLPVLTARGLETLLKSSRENR